jgi:hypothetical protein
MSFHEKNTHSLAVHLYPNLDNARVENTGFNPREWTLVIPLLNNIYPATAEQWQAGALFPQVWDALQLALQDKRSGVLQHPQIGNVICKVQGWTYEYSGEKNRDGVIVTANFIECLDDNVDIFLTNAVPNFGTPLLGTATALDNEITNPTLDPRLAPPGLNLLGAFTQIATYIKTIAAYPNTVINSANATITAFVSTTQSTVNSLVNTPATISNTFTSAFNNSANLVVNLPFNVYTNAITTYNSDNVTQFNVVANQKTTNNTDIANKYNGVKYNSQTLAKTLTAYQSTFGTANTNAVQAISKSLNFTAALFNYYKSLNNYQTAQIEQLLLAFQYNLYQTLKSIQSQTTGGYNILTLTTQNTITFYQLAKLTNNSIDQIMQLNPSISKFVFVPMNTTIRYYSGTGR